MGRSGSGTDLWGGAHRDGTKQRGWCARAQEYLENFGAL